MRYEEYEVRVGELRRNEEAKSLAKRAASVSEVDLLPDERALDARRNEPAYRAEAFRHSSSTSSSS
jgi:hypothetical protein